MKIHGLKGPWRNREIYRRDDLVLMAGVPPSGAFCSPVSFTFRFSRFRHFFSTIEAACLKASGTSINGIFSVFPAAGVLEVIDGMSLGVGCNCSSTNKTSLCVWSGSWCTALQTGHAATGVGDFRWQHRICSLRFLQPQFVTQTLSHYSLGNTLYTYTQDKN